MKRAALLAAVLAIAPGGSALAQYGATTHFSQGWPLTHLDRAEALGIATIRDSLHWAAIERVPGQYDFADAKTRHIRAACAKGMTVLLGIDPRNRLYDGGATAFTPEAQAAFANYIKAIADRFPGCVTAIEIGNEVNGQNGMTGAAAQHRALAHTALLRAVHQRVKPAHPALKLLGGSTNTVATGFLDKLFAAGALNHVDGIVVHPYRTEPEGLDWELERLNAAMRRHGVAKPIWATEFSREFASPEQAPDFALKMIALMGSSGVRNAYWYAMIDQKWFPTMGLLTLQGAPKPASQAYGHALKSLLPHGLPVRIDHGDPALYHVRFGTDRHVIWGAPRGFTVSGPAVFRRADGTLIASQRMVTHAPIIVEGATALRFDPGDVLADSFYGFGRAPISYHVHMRNNRELTLKPVDWTWTSYFGNPLTRQVVINQNGIGPAGNRIAPVEAVVRATLAERGPALLSFCVENLQANGDGATLRLSHNGTIVWSGSVTPRKGALAATAPVTLTGNDRLDFAVGPNGNAKSDRLRYHFRVSRTAASRLDCS